MGGARDQLDTLLGFVEDDFDSWEVESRHFPSKVGGVPAWLELASLPPPARLHCPHCALPMAFLMQAYAPDSREPQAFHRALFLFLCPAAACWSGPIWPLLVLRSQLARTNSFYPASPPPEEPGWRTDITAAAHGRLCPACGCRADKTCVRCKAVYYCSAAHQRLDWRAGHKAACGQGGPGAGGGARHGLLKEGLLEQEKEPAEEREAEGEEERFQELAEGGAGLEAEPGELEAVEAAQQEDEACARFRRRVARAPGQVLRHCRGGAPLACTARPALRPPAPCGQCGGPRTFELQVMPQLLFHLGLGREPGQGVDWGSIYVFTCAASCPVSGYVEEELQLRNFDASNLPGS